MEPAFQHLGKRIEETPQGTRPERIVTGLAPLIEHIRDTGGADDASVKSADGDVVYRSILDAVIFVAGDAVVLFVPFAGELTDRLVDQTGKIPKDKPRVLAANNNLAYEGQIIANKHLVADDEAGGEPLVVRIAETQDPRVVRMRATVADLHEAEVTIAVVGQGVGLVDDGQSVARQYRLDLGKKLGVWYRLPSRSASRCGSGPHILAFDGVGSSMEH